MPGRLKDKTAAADELDRLCRDHIACFKRPKSYRSVASLPKNNCGKALEIELRAWLKAPA